jgi:hypothetical protein
MTTLTTSCSSQPPSHTAIRCSRCVCGDWAAGAPCLVRAASCPALTLLCTATRVAASVYIICMQSGCCRPSEPHFSQRASPPSRPSTSQQRRCTGPLLVSSVLQCFIMCFIAGLACRSASSHHSAVFVTTGPARQPTSVPAAGARRVGGGGVVLFPGRARPQTGPHTFHRTNADMSSLQRRWRSLWHRQHAKWVWGPVWVPAQRWALTHQLMDDVACTLGQAKPLSQSNEREALHQLAQYIQMRLSRWPPLCACSAPLPCCSLVSISCCIRACGHRYCSVRAYAAASRLTRVTCNWQVPDDSRAGRGTDCRQLSQAAKARGCPPDTY